MNYFLFTTNIDQIELEKRFSIKKWPFFFNTKNVKNLQKDDRVIIYQAGTGNHKFVADITILSVTNTSKIKEIHITDISKWKKPIDIATLFDKLEIIKKPQHYGVYLAGGIKTLSLTDFTTILKAHNSNS